MKKQFIFLITLLLFASSIYAVPQLSYKFASPRIIRTGGIDYFEFEVQVKADVAGYYFWTGQIMLNFDNTVLNGSASNWGVTLAPAFTAMNSSPLTPQAKYTVTKSLIGSTLNIGVLGNVDAFATDPIDPLDWVEITPLYQLMFTVKGRITTPSGIALLDFNEAQINGFQQFVLGNSLAGNYINPCLFDPADFLTTYVGRIYSAKGWSQVGNSANSQWVNWNNNVSTTVWEGSATITQTDATAALVNNLRIENGAALAVPPKKWLTVAGTLSNNAGISGLVVQSDVTGTGSLFQSTGDVSGTVQRYMNNADWTNWQDGWHFLGSPVVTQPISAFATDPYDFYCWYEPADLWVNYKNTSVAPTWNTANGSNNFTLGKGYMVAYDEAGTKAFTGQLNVADVTVSGLTITGTTQTYRSWHLMGNPFSCALTWDASSAWNLVGMSGVAQIWNEGNQSYSPLTSSPASSIPATNGFMVQVQTAPGSLTLPAAKRAHSADPFYKSSNAFVKLVAHNVAVGNAQESFVYFNPDATTGFDQMYDGDFLEGYAPRFYSVSGEEHFSVNSLPQLVSNLQIPFDFIKNEGTSFSIQAAQIENIETQVYLTDLKLNQTQELTTNPVYNFTSTDGDNPARFVLSFGLMTGTGDKTDSNKGIYTFENNLYLVNPGKAKFEVYNLTGQKLQAQEIDSPGLFKTTLYLPTAYYVVRMTTGTKVVVKKVFIKS